MAEDASRGDGIAPNDLPAEGDEAPHLLGREVPVAELVAGIDQLDTDGTGVDVPLAGPAGHARVPGAPVLRHKAEDAAVLFDHVVGADLRGWIA